MSKYKVTVRLKTAQLAANEPKEQVGYTPSPGSYANSFVDQTTGQTVYLENNLQDTTKDNKPIYSTPAPFVPSETYKQIEQLRNNPNRDILKTQESQAYTQLVKNPNSIPDGMNPIKTEAIQDQRQVRQQALQGNPSQQKPRTYNYNQANNALYKALHGIGMENFNAVSLQANQDFIINHINQIFGNNPATKKLALDLLNQKIKAAGTQ
jgi:hypothetical protein